MVTAPTSCVLRLHEPLTRENWGGRATSLALARILEQDAGRRIVSTINARHLLSPLSTVDAGRLEQSAFTRVDRLVHAIVDADGAGKAAAVHRKIAAADELVVNGEGDFILTERRSLVRTLAMIRAAKTMGKPVYLLNCLLSCAAPEPPPHEQLIIDQVGAALDDCDAICYRDPTSLDLHRELFAPPAHWTPDALFGWADTAETSLADRGAFGPETEGLPVPVQRLLAGDQPYVVLSGTSRKDVPMDEFRSTVIAVRKRLRRRGIATVFAGSDGADRKLIGALKGTGTPAVDPKVPLTAAARLLWNAAAIVSGRYHPSILASLGGTPFLLMDSNSHKTASLYRVVEHPVAGEELPFFSGGEHGADRVVEAVLTMIDSPGTRSTVSRSAAANGRDVTAAFVRQLRDRPSPTDIGGDLAALRGQNAADNSQH